MEIKYNDISLDIETKSSYNLKLCGVYRYVESPDFTILMVAYKWRGEDQYHIIDLSREEFPQWLKDVLVNPKIKKRSHNANFERTCFAAYLGMPMPPQQWVCSMVQAARAGLPLGLDAAAKAVGSPVEKMTEGSGCIKYFSSPCRPTKTNGGRTWNLPHHDPEKWKTFLKYCKHDVKTEVAILNKTASFPVSQFEQDLWALDQKINDRGMLLDTKLVKNALRIHEEYVTRLKKEATKLTGLANSNSPAQLRQWIIDNGEEIEDMKKVTIADLLKELKTGKVARVLEIRQEMSKTSVKKYTAMRHCRCADGRVRGLLQFYGANRTGRWAGRMIQVQNLPQNKLKVDKELGIDDLTLARDIVRRGDGKLLAQMYGNVPDILSQLIRTAFIASPGRRLIISDFSAIEARVIAWLFNEQWRMEVFATHGKIYEASASKMFRVPLESISFKNEKGETVQGPNYHLRAKGKVSELALGYQGAVGALIQMGALKMGLDEDELPPMVKLWRKENKAIVNGWYRVQEQVELAITVPGRIVKSFRGIEIQMRDKNLYVKLPSGRELCYRGARIGKNRYGKTSIMYWGMDQTTKTWVKVETYGGKCVENWVQGIARDCMAVALMRLDYKGYDIITCVHDEAVLDVPIGFGSVEECNRIMSRPMKWAPDLPLAAAGFESPYYKKD